MLKKSIFVGIGLFLVSASINSGQELLNTMRPSDLRDPRPPVVVLDTNQVVLVVKSTIADLSFETNRKNIKPILEKTGVWLVYLEPGTHLITFSAPNFQSLTKEIYIAKEERCKEVEIIPINSSGRGPAITEIVGDLIIESNPPGAKIFLNNVDTDKLTPNTFVNVKVSEIRLEKEWYKTVRRTVQLNPSRATTVSVQMEPNFGTISVNGSPRNAIVNINADEKGRLPLENFRLLPGSYSIMVTAPDHYEFRQQVFVEKGRHQTIRADLKYHTGYITVVSDPTNATVEVDGTIIGKTPLYNAEIEKGNYTLAVYLDKEYIRHTSEISIFQGQSKTFEIRLESYIGSMQQRADSWGTRKWLGFIGAAASGAAAGYFKITADKAYNSYNSAISTDDAINLKNKTKKNDLYFWIASGTSGVIFTYALISWKKESQYASKAKRYSMRILKEKDVTKVVLAVQW